MKSKKPNPLRFIGPMLVGYVPAVAAFIWLHVMQIIHQMAKLAQPVLSSGVVDLIGVSIAIGTFISLFRLWADFVRGDYSFDLANWHDQRA